jgi:uncharacterized protein (DUF2267 family)
VSEALQRRNASCLETIGAHLPVEAKAEDAMALTGLQRIDATVHKTQRWIAEISDGLEIEDRDHALAALRVVLHVLRDHLPLQAAVALGAQLPLLVRGMYYEGWRPEAKQDRPRAKSDVAILIAAELPWATEHDLEKLTRTVLLVLRRHIDANEVEKLLHLLPKGLRELWSDSLAT